MSGINKGQKFGKLMKLWNPVRTTDEGILANDISQSKIGVSERVPHATVGGVRFGSKADMAAFPMSALPPKADIVQQDSNVRFVPKADSCTAAILAQKRTQQHCRNRCRFSFSHLRIVCNALALS